jgi:hypothetical protein
MLALIRRHGSRFSVRLVYPLDGRWVMGPRIVDEWGEVRAILQAVLTHRHDAPKASVDRAGATAGE